MAAKLCLYAQWVNVHFKEGVDHCNVSGKGQNHKSELTQFTN